MANCALLYQYSNIQEERLARLKKIEPMTVTIKFDNGHRVRYVYMKTYGYYKIQSILDTCCSKFDLDPSKYKLFHDGERLYYNSVLANLNELKEYSIIELSVSI